MPVLTALIAANFPEIAKKIEYRHWRNIFILLLGSAYGMLASFPFQGYGAISIIFSTISIVAGFYLAIAIRKSLKEIKSSTSHLFLSAGLFFMVISAIGPFATGPLIAMGKAGTSIYYNVIYFYLHFQYNGWFTFVVLALLYKMLEEKGWAKNGKRVFKMFALACIPSYFLSILWNHPSLFFNIAGGAAASVQVLAMYYLAKDVQPLLKQKNFYTILLVAAAAAFILKNVLQLISALPPVAHLAFLQRGYIIAYLHLVLLGFISMYVFSATIKYLQIGKHIQKGMAFFLIGFIITELLLIGNPTFNYMHFTIPYFPELLLLFSIVLFIGAALTFNQVRLDLQKGF